MEFTPKLKEEIIDKLEHIKLFLFRVFSSSLTKNNRFT